MSAESPRRTSRQGAHVVAPQPVSDRSIIESVAGFINEVVPQVRTFFLSYNIPVLCYCNLCSKHLKEG